MSTEYMVKRSSADGEDGRAEDQEGRVVAHGGDEAAKNDESKIGRRLMPDLVADEFLTLWKKMGR
jgi:hypothetical protein